MKEMIKPLLTLVILLLSLSSEITAQDCSASVKTIERAGSWMENGREHRIFDVYLTNTHSTNSIAGRVYVTVEFPPGSSMGYSWGYDRSGNALTVPEVAPGQTYSGIGFIVYGSGDPTVTVTGFSICGGTVTNTDPGDSKLHRPMTDPNAGKQDLGLQFLILSCKGPNANDSTLDVATLMMTSTGSTYDIISYAAVGASGSLSLTNSDGSGKYYAIVSTGDMRLCWSTDQQNQVQAYEKQFNVKMVVLYTFPFDTSGVSNTKTGGALSGTVTFAPEMNKWATSVKTTARVPVSGVYVYPTQIVNTYIATPAFYMQLDGDATQYVGAAFVTPGDGRRHLEFYFDSGSWALFACVLGPAWFNWVTNGIYLGSRRIEFNVHTDDVFMATGMYDAKIKDESETSTYRITSNDLRQIVAWQQDVVSRMPKGSTFVVTFPFNGATITETKWGGYTGDALYLYAKTVRDQFYWESHTYTHPYLDNLSYSEVTDEWVQNTQTARLLFDDDLDNPMYCKHSVVTPSISGLYNGEALRAMYDLGILNVFSDNSHPNQVPPNVYHGWYTNTTVNGFDGIYCVPRHATQIYYDASLPEHIASQYNVMYPTAHATYESIMASEILVSTKNLLQFRHDPFMFHQANMRIYSYNGKNTSLLGYWVDQVLASVMSYSTLPLTSHKHDDLVTRLKARECRDECGFSARLHVDPKTDKVVGLWATSSKSCNIGISGVVAEKNSQITEQEVYGDERTVWFDISPSTPFELEFDTPISLV